MFGVLLKESNQTVSAVASRRGIPCPSQQSFLASRFKGIPSVATDTARRKIMLAPDAHTLQSVRMTAPPSRRQSLWRTCRVLANRNRLRMFGLLLKEPDQTVSKVASRLGLPLSVTSQYLRALEARGFLTVRREGRWVYYRPASAQAAGSAEPLMEALRQVFQRTANPVDQVFKLATAFTHQRRIEVLRALSAGARTLVELRAGTRISRDALGRHVAKLKARGFVATEGESVAAVKHGDGLGRALAQMAGG